MAGDVKFSIEGAKAFEQIFKELGSRVAPRVGAQGLRAAAKPIVERAKELAPVRTGALRDSITSEVGKRGDESISRSIGWERPVSRRAHLVEFGTVHMPAQSHIRKAMDTQQEAALNEMARVMQRGIEREARKLAGQTGRRR